MAVLSVITAFLNEEQNLPAFRQRMSDVAATLEDDIEIVLVDDHSTDESSRIGIQWAEHQDNVQYIRLSHNCGSHAAFSAGLLHCSGDCAILLAADLQDPPESIPELLRHWRGGNDVVWAARSDRLGERWSTKFFSQTYYAIMKRLALPEMPSHGADFLLMDRKVVDAYNSIPEKNTSFLAMILWMGYRQTFIQYVKQERNAGSSKWTLSKKLKLMIDSVVSFSYFPIRFMSGLGMLMACSGLLYALIVIIGRLLGWIDAGTGYAAIMTVLLVGQGLILAMLGVLGEYVWRTFDESRGRPRYLIERHISRMQTAEESGSDRGLVGNPNQLITR